MTINIFEGARRIAKLLGLLWIIGFAAYLIYFPFSDPYITVTYVINGPGTFPVRSQKSCGYTENASRNLTITTKKGTKAHATLCFIAWTSNKGEKLIPYRRDPKSGQWWGGTEYSSEVMEYTASVLRIFTGEDPDDWVEVDTPKAAEPDDIDSFLDEPASAATQASSKTDDIDAFLDEDTTKRLPSDDKSTTKLRPSDDTNDFSRYVEKPQYTKDPQRSQNEHLLTQADEEWIDTEWWRKLTEQAKLSLAFVTGGIASLWSFTWVVGWIVRGFLGIPMGQDFRTKL